MTTKPDYMSLTTTGRDAHEGHFWAGDSEQQLMLPFGDAISSDTETGDDQPQIVRSISPPDPIRRIVIFLAERAALEDHIAWEAGERHLT